MTWRNVEWRQPSRLGHHADETLDHYGGRQVSTARLRLGDGGNALARDLQACGQLSVGWDADVFVRIPGCASFWILPLAIDPGSTVGLLVDAGPDLREGRADLVIRIE